MPKHTDTEQALNFRVSTEQRSLIEKAARHEDRTLSSFLRVAAMDRVNRVLGQAVGQRTTNLAA